jgi:hypothetical protein
LRDLFVIAIRQGPLAGGVLPPITAMAVLLLLPVPCHSQTAPVADAGPSRYAAREPITLDGTGSHDPDGGVIVDFEWYQLSGPEVVISGDDTATPVISGFLQVPYIQTVEIGLVVSDGELNSPEDVVEVVIVPIIRHETLSLINEPFRPHRPTLVTFGGGNCVDGTHMPLNARWQEHFNIITGRYFFPYADHAYQLMVMLSSLAPDYQQPIQTVGFSSGGNPASIIPNIINQYFHDPRFAINRITLLDTYCDPDLDQEVAEFNSHPVAGEPAWVEVLRSAPEPVTGALNISFFPGGDHNTPFEWFLASAETDVWPDGDMYNHGITGGYFVSVAGPARHLQLATGGLHYYFECPEMAPGCLRQTDGALYPGLLPEPVTLIGPEDGARVASGGAVLTCLESEHATSYELLFGEDPRDVTLAVSVTPAPPETVVTEFPYSSTYWTIRVRDRFGTTIHATPRVLYPQEPRPVRRVQRRVRSQP